MKLNYLEITLSTLNKYLKESKKSEIIAVNDSKLIDDLSIDSLDMIELSFLMQDEFSIEIDPEKIIEHNIKTVKDLSEIFEHAHSQAIK
jgi:acyl carrier protein